MANVTNTATTLEPMRILFGVTIRAALHAKVSINDAGDSKPPAWKHSVIAGFAACNCQASGFLRPALILNTT